MLQTWKLGCLPMSVKLLLSAVQRDFEMEILLRRSELGAVEGCKRETDDNISFSRFPHAYSNVRQISFSTYPRPMSTHRCKQIHTYRPVLTKYRSTTHNSNNRTHNKYEHAHTNTVKNRAEQLTSKELYNSRAN